MYCCNNIHQQLFSSYCLSHESIHYFIHPYDIIDSELVTLGDGAP